MPGMLQPQPPWEVPSGWVRENMVVIMSFHSTVPSYSALPGFLLSQLPFFQLLPTSEVLSCSWRSFMTIGSLHEAICLLSTIPPHCHSRRAAFFLLGTGLSADCDSRWIRWAPSLGSPLDLKCSCHHWAGSYDQQLIPCWDNAFYTLDTQFHSTALLLLAHTVVLNSSEVWWGWRPHHPLCRLSPMWFLSVQVRSKSQKIKKSSASSISATVSARPCCRAQYCLRVRKPLLFSSSLGQGRHVCCLVGGLRADFQPWRVKN